MHEKRVEDVLSILNSSEQGLTSLDAEVRLHKYGFNELKKVAETAWLKIFINQLTSPLLWVLIAASIISFYFEKFTEVINERRIKIK